MNVWDWVNKKIKELYGVGHYRLAQIMDEISSYTSSGQHQRVDAIVPEGLALARSLNEKWVEVYLRHWHLQSLVLHRHEVEKALPQAISLLDFSHQNETLDCPQSVCAVQDLSVCYAYIDGPGYAKQRLDVAQETLDRINPAWQCYACISSEYAGAIIDQQQYQQALDYFDQCNQAKLKAGLALSPSDYVLQEVKCLIALKRFQQARNKLAKVTTHLKGKMFDLELKISLALVAAHEQNYEEAKSQLPEFVSIENEVAAYENWLNVQYLLAINGFISNDWRLGRRFETCVKRMIAQGIIRISIKIAVYAFKLALARNSFESAQLMLAEIEQLIPRLVTAIGAEQQLAALQTELQTYIAKQPTSKPLTYEHVCDLIADLPNDDPEHALCLLNRVPQDWRADEDFCLSYSDQLFKLQRINQAITVMQDFLKHAPDSPNVILGLGDSLCHFKYYDEFVAFFDRLNAVKLSEKSQISLHWVNANYLSEIGDLVQAKNSLQLILQQQPNAVNARLMLAELERELENYPEALRHIDYLIEFNDDKSLHWDRMLAATFMQNWTAVRESARLLNIELDETADDNEEIFEHWEYCRIRYRRTTGEYHNLLAQRTGPVTARVIGISNISEQDQHFDDDVIFNPLALNSLDFTDEDGNSVDADGYSTYIYDRLKVVRCGGYSTYDLEGVNPGNEQLLNLNKALSELEVILHQCNSDEYRVFHQVSAKEFPGYYAYLLVPDKSLLSKVHLKLTQWCQNLEHPLVWRKLVLDLGDEQASQVQADIALDYNL